MNKYIDRVYVLQENNTAQDEITAILQKQKKSSKEISINKPLSGAIDLKILVSVGFKKMNHLFFSEGKITSIANIPDGIIRFECANNLLETIDNLPDTIEELDLRNNMIKSIDISRLHKLKILRLSHNELSELNGFPESLEELYCEYNNIEVLNLKNTPHLKIFHCRGNTGLVMETLPDSIIDSRLPEEVVINHNKTNNIKNKEYYDFVKQYFQIKSKYEKDVRKIRENQKGKKVANKLLPRCLGCNKQDGMIFSSNDDKFQCICGSSTPCDWKIIIHRGFHVDYNSWLYALLEEVEEHKQKFIQLKLDTIFEYVSEHFSTKLFDKQLQAYKSTSDLLTTMLQNYNDNYFNKQKMEAIVEKQKLIQEKLLVVKQHLTNHEIDSAVKIQYEEIAALSKSIQLEQYEVMKIISNKKENWKIAPEEQEPEEQENHVTYYLIQEEVNVRNLDYNMREKPYVEYFGKKIGVK
jgi:Leucine-rich repeat (LRR) protein